MADAQRFGILDAEDFWMGDADGPITYEDERLARAAATILWERFEHDKHFEVAPFTGADKLHDELTPRISGLEAVRRAEGERPNRSLPSAPSATETD